MSERGRPLLHEVIPMIDVIDGMLKGASNDRGLKPAVRVAASLGRAVLNRYYSKTDDSIMYRCAMIMHPRYKLAYFRTEGWLQDWIDTALDIVRREWDRYKPSSSEAASQLRSQGTSLFAALDTYGTEGSVDALEDYLNTPPIPSISDPLKHWHALDSEKNPLARMALDMLSAPATSVDAERSFSRGGLVVSKLRHNLSDESTRAATVLNSWMQIPGLVPKQSIVQTFKTGDLQPILVSTRGKRVPIPMGI
ncbi:hypothetical protein K466DRAFT_579083 [Polyporus arcularius HHB13444]|uniref:HAT C-terminal dimerisation domain-containing protein n=1 Tax=Polyporus arcularius HHB13444 TaxID=1314778 RepID=A0A5C3NSY1_9APHY|nr:hypothetical protein K466DRAFT_579083 [Polyporus arcularius HHB13444]